MRTDTKDQKALLDYRTKRYAIGPVLIRAGDDPAAMHLGDPEPALVFLDTKTQRVHARVYDGLVMSLYSLAAGTWGGAEVEIDGWGGGPLAGVASYGNRPVMQVASPPGKQCCIVDARVIAEKIAAMAAVKGWKQGNEQEEVKNGKA